ncbi:MAG: DUF1615 domain-containing protein [Burkholderiales bacterium]
MRKPVRLAAAVLVLLAGCATTTRDPLPGAQQQRSGGQQQRTEGGAIVRGPALVEELLPTRLADRRGWAEDMYAALAALRIEPTAENVCAVIAIVEQESSFRVDPAVPGLPELARRELDKRRERAGVPKVVAESALKLASSDGRTYGERLDAATTERHVSDMFEDFASRVPLGKSLFGEQNPVRSGGPMQVSIAFAQRYAASSRYPFAVQGSMREEVFTRRGGLYFGIAHLFDYDAPYDDLRYRFADYNAGRYASRNAAFQKAVGELTGAALELDGDLLRFEQGKPTRELSRTENAVRTLAGHFEMTNAEVRSDLELGQSAEFERSRLYLSVFTMVDGVLGRHAPRAVVPMIVVESFKTPRRLTSYGYAMRVGERHKACLAQL